jgi:hypothetical protein
MNQRSKSQSADAPSITAPPDQGLIDTATLDLLAGWRRSDATDNPDEVRAAERDLAEFKRAMNENRIAAKDPALYP